MTRSLFRSKDHFNENKHACTQSHGARRDFQVPLCPLCNQPVPYKRTEMPDIAMSTHIDRDCKSDPAEVLGQLSLSRSSHSSLSWLTVCFRRGGGKYSATSAPEKAASKKRFEPLFALSLGPVVWLELSNWPSLFQLIPFQCQKCRRNYCIRHRLEIDHDCAEVVAQAAAPSAARVTSSRNSQPVNSQIRNPGSMVSPSPLTTVHRQRSLKRAV